MDREGAVMTSDGRPDDHSHQSQHTFPPPPASSHVNGFPSTLLPNSRDLSVRTCFVTLSCPRGRAGCTLFARLLTAAAVGCVLKSVSFCFLLLASVLRTSQSRNSFIFSEKMCRLQTKDLFIFMKINHTCETF